MRTLSIHFIRYIRRSNRNLYCTMQLLPIFTLLLNVITTKKKEKTCLFSNIQTINLFLHDLHTGLGDQFSFTCYMIYGIKKKK